MFEKEIELIERNMGKVMHYGNTTTTAILPCMIIGHSIQKKLVGEGNDLFILVCKSKDNGVNFPVSTLKDYTIRYDIEGLDKKLFMKVPYQLAQIKKDTIIGACLPDNFVKTLKI